MDIHSFIGIDQKNVAKFYKISWVFGYKFF